jgi:hypothetical protein
LFGLALEKLIFANVKFDLNVKLQTNNDRERKKNEKAYQMTRVFVVVSAWWVFVRFTLRGNLGIEAIERSFNWCLLKLVRGRCSLDSLELLGLRI